jgi:flagellar biosynthesis anti-sigma factor FlgM
MKLMANTISGISNSILSSEVEAPDQTTNSAAAARSSAASHTVVTPESDHAELSGAGQALSQALQKVGALSSLHPALVTELKGKIASGTYNPDPMQVANSVAKALRELT